MVTIEYLALVKVQNTKWIALQDKKVDPEIKAMKAEIKSLQDQIKNSNMELQHKSTMTPAVASDANANMADHPKNLTCCKCKNKGHIAKKCPTKGTAAKT